MKWLLKIRIWVLKRRMKFMKESIRVDSLVLENWSENLIIMKNKLEAKEK